MLVGKPETKRPLASLGRIWEDKRGVTMWTELKLLTNINITDTNLIVFFEPGINIMPLDVTLICFFNTASSKV
jgi:hypothetical protein